MPSTVSSPRRPVLFLTTSLLALLNRHTVSAQTTNGPNLIVEVEADPNNQKYNRAWSLWKFCGCATATADEGTIGGMGAIADHWSMGQVFADMDYDVDYMPLDPFMVHVNVSWLYSDHFYSSVVANYLASERNESSSSGGLLTDAEYQAAETYVYGTLAPQEQEVHLEYIHIGWDTVDEEGIFSFITDFRGHIPVRKGDEVCWDGMHMYNVSTAAIESVTDILSDTSFAGVGLDFHVGEGQNLCKDVTGW